MSKTSLKNDVLKQNNVLGRVSLWKYGITGHQTIITVKTDENTIERCKSFIGAFALLKKQRVNCDFVFVFSESIGYDQTITKRLTSIISNYGLCNLIGKSNGIFLININEIDEYSLIQSVSDYIFNLSSAKKINKN